MREGSKGVIFTNISRKAERTKKNTPNCNKLKIYIPNMVKLFSFRLQNSKNLAQKTGIYLFDSSTYKFV